MWMLDLHPTAPVVQQLCAKESSASQGGGAHEHTEALGAVHSVSPRVSLIGVLPDAAHVSGVPAGRRHLPRQDRGRAAGSDTSRSGVLPLRRPMLGRSVTRSVTKCRLRTVALRATHDVGGNVDAHASASGAARSRDRCYLCERWCGVSSPPPAASCGMLTPKRGYPRCRLNVRCLWAAYVQARISAPETAQPRRGDPTNSNPG